MSEYHSNSRRRFLRHLSLTGAGTLLLPDITLAGIFDRENFVDLTILHTNDMHSQIDPFADDDPKYPGMGGMSRRATLISSIREERSNVLLLDSGDIFQGTPYFNFFGGEPELKLMTMMQYDAATMGNHDFDNGLEGFTKVLPHAGFPFICSNYDFGDTLLNGKTIAHKVLVKDGIRIGLFGLGVELEGLVSSVNYGNTRYLDPVTVAEEKALFLRKEEKCDYVICLSHLGYAYESSKVSDSTLAVQTRNIDLIIGGHTHTFLDTATSFTNADGREVLVNQAGWGGLRLGRIEVRFHREKGRNHEKEFSYIYKGYGDIC